MATTDLVSGELEIDSDKKNDFLQQNEELLEKINIKDEYIATLKLQLNNQEKLQTQNEWKLSQADDNLEMVEREKEEMEKKAVGKNFFFQ